MQNWAVSYRELAEITGVSLSTVGHWFSGGASHREPLPSHCRQLGIVHFIWCNADLITPGFIQFWCAPN